MSNIFSGIEFLKLYNQHIIVTIIELTKNITPSNNDFYYNIVYYIKL